ncbi:MAG: polysaccharide export protein [Leptolyngbyaceae cyanobacterium SM2_5_2]|nr:polysaccharide export protein [Leptolyngbyaceae cyanobacterium SM2_5_2]
MDGLSRVACLVGGVGAVLSISMPYPAAVAQTLPSMGSTTINSTAEPLNPLPAEQTSPAAPAAIAEPVQPSGVEENYRLGPGDVIQVEVFNVPEYSGSHQIAVDGTISLPVIGRFRVANLSPQQAGDAIAAKYVLDLQFPIVSVTVVQPRPLQISVIGEITQPGLYTIQTNQGSQYPTVFQLLQTAGGVTQAANLREVEIRRINGNGAQPASR